MIKHTWQKNAYLISTDKDKLDHQVIYRFLAQSYWATGRSLQQVKDSIENSLCFGMYKNDQQIGFARVITDYVTFAYLADVFILPGHRGDGLGKWLVGVILETPELQKNSFWLLLTKDAQKLYKKLGFHKFDFPDGVMVKGR